MTAHVKIAGTSWCQLPFGQLPKGVREAAMARQLGPAAPICQHTDPAQAECFANTLRRYGLDARAVDGPCDQRDTFLTD